DTCGKHVEDACSYYALYLVITGDWEYTGIETRDTFRADCEAGSAVGCLNLSRTLQQTSDGSQESIDEVLDLLRRSCDLNQEVGCSEYVLTMTFVDQLEDARQLAESGCNADATWGCTGLGDIHQLVSNGPDGSHEDIVTAVRMYERACDAGVSTACDRLGQYYIGEGEAEQGLPYFERSCARLSGFGCMQLATYYSAGVGVPQSSTRYLELLEQACQYNNGDACYSVAYELGIGPTQSATNARVRPLVERACRLGSAVGCQAVGYLEELAGNYDEGAEQYAQTCGYGYIPACIALADVHEGRRVSHPDRALVLQTYAYLCSVGVAEYCGKTSQLP
ncbi:MAG: sel1 repeat family protein, partial [Myxococcales bacterium]|nr:sel1 repeat family protein [Myxococcales bacterium]